MLCSLLHIHFCNRYNLYKDWHHFDICIVHDTCCIMYAFTLCNSKAQLKLMSNYCGTLINNFHLSKRVYSHILVFHSICVQKRSFIINSSLFRVGTNAVNIYCLALLMESCHLIKFYIDRFYMKWKHTVQAYRDLKSLQNHRQLNLIMSGACWSCIEIRYIHYLSFSWQAVYVIHVIITCIIFCSFFPIWHINFGNLQIICHTSKWIRWRMASKQSQASALPDMYGFEDAKNGARKIYIEAR